MGPYLLCTWGSEPRPRARDLTLERKYLFLLLQRLHVLDVGEGVEPPVVLELELRVDLILVVVRWYC